jgi:(p)ppGpp synthase/HD superfamily hydrolase
MVAHLPGATEEMVVAAYLHDTIEDTGAKPEEIEAVFGPKVRKLTEELTNPSSKEENKPLPRTERRVMDREHLAHVSPEAKRIKLMDRLHNLMGAKNAPKDYALTLLAPETRALVAALGDVDPESKKRVLDEVDRMEAHHKKA